jgi:HEXXH motif-containing protein
MTSEALLSATAYATSDDVASAAALDQALRLRWMRVLAALVARAPDELRYAAALRYIESHAGAGALCMAQLFQPALGQVEHEDGQPIDVMLLHVCLLLTAAGCPGSWQLTLEQPVGAYFGVCLLSWQGEVRCDSDGDECSVTGCLADGAALTLRRSHGNWHSAALSASWVEEAGIALPVLPVSVESRDAELIGTLPAPDCTAAQAGEQLRAAIALIAANSPAHLAWIRRALRGVLVVGTPDGSTASGSSSSHPGLIFVSWPMDVVQCATLLIHESAHQHLGVLASQAQLTDGDPAKTCYSTFKRSQRPVYKVLLALHAAVNMRQFTARLLAAGSASVFARREDAELQDGIARMHAALGGSDALTPLGQRFLAWMMRHG